MGYQGEAQVHPCSEDNEEFSLTGCEKITCGSPSPDQTGYIITENNLNISEFDVEIKCDETNGYFGTPTINPCTDDGEPYTFTGCEFKNQECSIPDTTGYILDIKNQSINNFNITAQCNKSMGYQGEAKVFPCSEDNEEFTLTGCEKSVVVLQTQQATLLLKIT